MANGPFLEPTHSLPLVPWEPLAQRTKYEGQVVAIGPMVSELMDAGVLIFFGVTAPPELREIAIIHTGTNVSEPIVAGDAILLGSTRYTVTGVGELANKNIAELGHVVIKANGATTTELPGELSVAVTPLRLPAIGALLQIIGAAASVPDQILATPPATLPALPPEPSTMTTALSTTPIRKRRSLWAFLNVWRNSKRLTDPSA